MSSADASALSFWSAVSLLGIVLVFVGVFLEGIETFIRGAAFFRRKKLRMVWNKLPEPHVPAWAHVVDHMGWFILVVGLAFEWRAHVKTEEILDRESRRLNSELAIAIETAGKASLSAAESNERSKQLESTNLQVSLKIEELRKANHELEKQIAETKTNIAKIDPRNQPIGSLKGSATILIHEKTLLDVEGLNQKGFASLKLGTFRSNENPHRFEIWTSSPVHSVAVGEKISRMVINVEFDLRDVGTPGAREALTVNRLKAVRMEFGPHVSNPSNPVRILGGWINLTLNGLKVEFRIPAQTNTDFTVSSVKINDPEIDPFNSFIPIENELFRTP